MEYNGGRIENEIYNWILKKVGPPTVDVTCEELKKKVEIGNLVLAYFGEKDAKEYTDIFKVVAEAPESLEGSEISEKYQFFNLNDKECAQHFGASTLPALVMFRKFEESPIVYSGSWEQANVIEWMQKESVPTLINFAEEYLESIFGGHKATLYLFRNEEDAKADFSQTFEKVAKELKGEVYFAVSGIKEGIQQKLAEFIGIEDSQLPMMMILHPSQNMKKYTFTHPVKGLQIEHVKSFIKDFKSGIIKPFLKSEDPPAEQNEPVKVVVGTTFKDIVLDENKDVLIEFYAPWCGHCKELAPIWEQVAKDLADVPNLVLAKFDATANEVEDLEIAGFPTIKFYPRDNKSFPTDYEEGREAEEIKKWLQEHSTAYKKHLENKSEL